MPDKIIEMKNVNKWFGDFQVLKDINLEVQSKQRIKAKIEIINLRERPPQAVVSTHSKPKLPPWIKLNMINGKTNIKKIIKYFFNFIGI